MTGKPYQKVGEIFYCLSGEKRAKAFWLIFSEEKKPKTVADELGITRQGLQKYVSRWKDAGLVESEGNQYVLTDEGVRAYEILEQALDQH